MKNVNDKLEVDMVSHKNNIAYVDPSSPKEPRVIHPTHPPTVMLKLIEKGTIDFFKRSGWVFYFLVSKYEEKGNGCRCNG